MQSSNCKEHMMCPHLPPSPLPTKKRKRNYSPVLLSKLEIYCHRNHFYWKMYLPLTNTPRIITPDMIAASS